MDQEIEIDEPILTCKKCQQHFKIIRENVVSCKCGTKFVNISQTVRNYQENYYPSIAKH